MLKPLSKVTPALLIEMGLVDSFALGSDASAIRAAASVPVLSAEASRPVDGSLAAASVPVVRVEASVDAGRFVRLEPSPAKLVALTAPPDATVTWLWLSMPRLVKVGVGIPVRFAPDTAGSVVGNLPSGRVPVLSADASLDAGTLSSAVDTTSPFASSKEARSLAFVMLICL